MIQESNHYVLIMAGGIGSRFWPVSRKSLPKQFIDILGTGESLITQTYNRFSNIVPEENIIVVTNFEYVDMVKKHIPTITDAQILAEPQARNTAPCIAFANAYIKSKNPNALCVVAPSDHLITNDSEFKRIINESFEFAAQYQSLVTIGIKPTRPDTGYGYIQYNVIPTQGNFHEVKTFTEKPTMELAQSFIDSGEFLWNAGIFVWHVNTIAQKMETHLPEVAQVFVDIDFNNPNWPNDIEKAYGFCPSISIDYGVLEKDDGVYVIPATFGWNDLGTWKSLWDVLEKDEKGNAAVGRKIHIQDTKGSMVFNGTERLVIANGLNDLVVVESDDVLLIMHKDKEQDLRRIVNQMRDEYKGKIT
ncbi:MAG: mannose-1-phosphate guanylyltransferase [Bacteroidia bacterium]|nr:mannose-1-phosphate guanylyltransferase [Bacteroidia bacterium]